jgi:hypothetical protein
MKIPAILAPSGELTQRQEALNWIYDNQLGRRNLTDRERSNLRGKRYEGEKNVESFKGNQYTEKSGEAQNEPHQNAAEKIAEQTGVSKATIKRDAQFSKAIDLIKKDWPRGQSMKIPAILAPSGELTQPGRKA